MRGIFIYNVTQGPNATIPTETFSQISAEFAHNVDWSSIACDIWDTIRDFQKSQKKLVLIYCNSPELPPQAHFFAGFVFSHGVKVLVYHPGRNPAASPDTRLHLYHFGHHFESLHDLKIALSVL